MRRLLLQIIIVFLLFSFLTSFLSADEDQASRLFLEAYQLAKSTGEEDAYKRASIIIWIADKCFKAGQEDKASELLSKSFELAKILNDNNIKDNLLAEISLEYAKEGQYEQALKVAKEIHDGSKIDLAVIKATALIKMADKCFQADPKDKGFDLLSQALAVAKTINSDPKKRDTVLAEITVQYVKTGEYDVAFQLAKTIDYSVAKAIALANIAEAYVRAEKKEKACEILSQAFDVVDASKDISSYHRGIALAQIGIKFAKTGQYERAIRVAEMIEDAYGKATALAGISVEYFKAGQKDKAAEILSWAIREAKTIYASQSGRAVDSLVDIYVLAGKYDQALQIAQTIEDPLTRAFELAVIASAQSEEKK